MSPQTQQSPRRYAQRQNILVIIQYLPEYQTLKNIISLIEAGGRPAGWKSQRRPSLAGKPAPVGRTATSIITADQPEFVAAEQEFFSGVTK
ncbi:hypothetical protein E5K00_19925 [Hymenobacter aquaticus]|uniref:Uncharacterized protein n=1 Tax=Hymenobacter aquaticus TaxID=1867101 RepID=A0A4Z0PRK1_9BACT|nr:hypothetical protein [Hymenobacter aquaticus]TGE20278.1 hypothetical protein E5K00_19925 [Hymenobacter aquaticus]